jgi:hypothetical protein
MSQDGGCDNDCTITVSAYGVIFFNCSWVSSWWQWSVNLYKNRKETTVYMRRNTTQNNTKTQNTQNRKKNINNKKTNIKRIIKNIKRVTET